MAGGSSRRAKRRRRHARWGKPVYRPGPKTGMRPGGVIVDEVPVLLSVDPGTVTGVAVSDG